MDTGQWFHQQLQTSAESLLWAVEQVPPEHLYLEPRPNRWSVARIIYHTVSYEQRLAFPSMQQWAGGVQPIVGTQEEDDTQDDRTWNAGQSHEIAALIADFKTIRNQQLAVLPQFSEQDWREQRETVWGQRSLRWVVTKTYQHTLEHTNEILCCSLFWK